jgi:deazaflavin-dependent oxidoreductase (nitroreductase family)
VSDDYCYLTTRGRVTGNDHEIEIWYVREVVDGRDRVFMLAGAGDASDWVRNLQADPAVRVRIDDVTHAGHARVVTDTDEDRHARTVVFEKYQPRNAGELTTWRERALPVAIDLDWPPRTARGQS